MAEVLSILPVQPFDGQEFIDSFRMKWVFNAEADCWHRIGTVLNLPVANVQHSGLLSALQAAQSSLNKLRSKMLLKVQLIGSSE